MNEPVPHPLLSSMASAAGRAGIPVPEVSNFCETIILSKGIRAVALELGRLLSQRNIFLRNDVVVTVDAETGAVAPMDARRFPTWAEEFCVFMAPGSRKLRDSISVEDSSQVLCSDIFKGCLRPLRAVNLIRLPVRRKDNSVEWLEKGYDKESEIFTVDRLPYPQDWKVGEAQEFLMTTMSEYPWNRKEGEKKTALHQNRSFCVQVALLVGAYCRGLFPQGTLTPIGAYFGNKPGTGKTRLAEMVQIMLTGMATPIDNFKDDKDMSIQLQTVAQVGMPFAFFDDIGARLRSNVLNRWTTETWHTGRKFHSNAEVFQVPAVTQVLLTANDLKTSEDLGRRALVVELFLDEEVKGRSFPKNITPSWLQRDDVRAKFLASCCALVRHWISKEMPLHPRPVPTFEDWTEVVAGIVVAADFSDPLVEPEGDVGGAVDEDEVKQLLILAASGCAATCEMNRKELINLAQQHGLLEDLLGTEGDVDGNASKAFGRRMQRWRGQKLRDDKGRTFQFSHKKKKQGAVYPITFLL